MTDYSEELNGKVVVITGASAGVGRATARAFAKYDTKIALLARGKEGLEGAAKEIEKSGSEALVFQVDVAQADQIETAAQEIEAKWGNIDIWVNNAMVSVFSPFKEMTPEEFKRVTEVTYLGQVYGTMSALKRMVARDKGSIVLVGSALAYRGIPLQSAYCGSKHATQGVFDSVRSELMHDKSNVHIGMVHLPALNTTQFSWVKTRFDKKPKPMGTIYQPEVAADAILYMATHPNRRSVYVGWSTVQTILGNKVFPGIGDQVLAKGGFSGQLTDNPEDPDRKNNLLQPVGEDRGAHGEFDQESKDHSLQFWASKNKDTIGMVALAGLASALILSLFKK